MANDFHFEELGSRAFEQLSSALVSAEFGPGLEVYGSGKDGGREAVFQGTISWDGGARVWRGYTVVQAKQREHVLAPADNLAWLQSQIRFELNHWMNVKRHRGKFPDHILFVTNVRLSAAVDGGVDRIREFLVQELDRSHASGKKDTPRMRGLREIRVWHRDTLNALISNHRDVRSAFPALLTVGDLLERLNSLPGLADPDALASILREHSESALRHDRWVRFGEAGGLHARQSVDRVVVDLPVISDDDRGNVLDECMGRGEPVLRRSVPGNGWPRHLVITGAAGNGKSTIAKYLTQIYRARFLEGATSVAAVNEIIADTAESLERLMYEAPTSRRWPLNVSLPEMANDMGPSGGPSMLRWLSRQVSQRASVEITPVTLERWLKAWPVILVLDGFDEVTAPSLRQRVVDEIMEFVDRADELDADLFVVLTTRPTGYTERIRPTDFAQIDLDYLAGDEAVSYGKHVTTQRLHDDVSLREQVLERFDRAVAQASTGRLIKTPLQVLILTFILENVGDLPATRYQLFWSYYDTVYRREQEKPTSHRAFLRGHRDDITELHERVGLVLQTRCEGTDEAQARLSLTGLRSLAHDRMIEVGHDSAAGAGELADQIVEIATTRLVLLAAGEDDSVSFEVRSLQELMAARALVNGDDATIRENLVATAPSPHWRNTWVFAAGKLFGESDHRRRLVLDIVDQFDRTCAGWPGWIYPVGPELAADLLDDGLAETKPAALRELVTIALRCLAGPMPENPAHIAGRLSDAARHGQLNALIRNELRAAFAGTPAAVAVAGALVLFSSTGGASGVSAPGQPAKAAMEEVTKRWFTPPPQKPRVKVGNLLGTPLKELRDEPGAALVEAALTECNALTLYPTSDGELWPELISRVFECERLQSVLDDVEASGILELCLGDLEPRHWAARSHLAREIAAVRSRRPVSNRLAVPYLD
ncbi:hypothetical protein VA596_24830 [Amycolatopsis sp., V23-08]|uniref:NACHT domain-containing protein n=1 Tax=Amycolatopsis heterodermiae TaxID=3110235 RepID=A0ABU5RAZ9_9PSEU|nr:hypothetical protein [Amycolatopsis sp., V23-08]MEA5362785.1 hypothetical protein [Amycolatopsis sp., V23-08]